MPTGIPWPMARGGQRESSQQHATDVSPPRTGHGSHQHKNGWWIWGEPLSGDDFGITGKIFWTGAQQRAGGQGWQDQAAAPHCFQRGFGFAVPQGPSVLHGKSVRPCEIFRGYFSG